MRLPITRVVCAMGGDKDWSVSCGTSPASFQSYVFTDVTVLGGGGAARKYMNSYHVPIGASR